MEFAKELNILCRFLGSLFRTKILQVDEIAEFTSRTFDLENLLHLKHVIRTPHRSGRFRLAREKGFRRAKWKALGICRRGKTKLEADGIIC